MGKTAKLKIIRAGKPLEISHGVGSGAGNRRQRRTLRLTPISSSALRELSYNDRLNLQLPDALQGVLLQKVETGGWASLGGLRGHDFVMSVAGKPTPTVAELKAVLDQVRKDKPRRIVFFVRRGIHTLYCEIEPDYR